MSFDFGSAVDRSRGAVDKIVSGVDIIAGEASLRDRSTITCGGVELERGFIAIDDRMQTSVPGIYAIGDVTGKLMLAHVASAQGMTAVDTIVGKETPSLDYAQIPRATFCQPQVGSIGLTETQAREAMIGHDINDLLGEATLSALLEATTVEVGFAVHAHPMLAEAVKEAALAVNGEAIHIAHRRRTDSQQIVRGR